MTLLILLAQTPPAGDGKVAIDDERLQDGVPKGLQKVELDLDDALFLEFEEKEDVTASTSIESLPEPEDALESGEQAEGLPEASAKAGRKKIWFFGIAAILCLLLGAGGAYFFMKSGPPLSEKQASTASDSPQGENTATETGTPASLGAESTNSQQTELLLAFPLEQFQVEYTRDGKTRFLTSRFSIPDTTPVMRAELQSKTIFIRDGIYRYLKNSPLSFLDNPQESEKLKTDIASVINQNIKSGQISEILIEEYVVQ
ncbi:MAG: flagellar basal body-associated FliL family protein [Desulfomicrobium sp.]|nr:flagellar basal body-associated FliL family protein [Desulfomicrobium sp.]